MSTVLNSSNTCSNQLNTWGLRFGPDKDIATQQQEATDGNPWGEQYVEEDQGYVLEHCSDWSVVGFGSVPKAWYQVCGIRCMGPCTK